MNKEKFTMDFTDNNEEGFITLPKGPQKAKTKRWSTYIKEETGNRVFTIPFVITEGEFEKIVISAFQTLSQEPISKNMFLKMLADLGIVKEGDRGEDKKLKIDFDLVTEEDNKTYVSAIIVNGQKRSVENLPATIIITHYTDSDGEVRHSVKSIEKVSASGKAGKASAGKLF